MQKQNGISTLVGIIIIVVVAAILFGSVFAYQYFTKSQQNSEFFGSSQKTDQTLTAGWKTYANNDYGFEIKYPADMLISAEDYNAQFYLHYRNAKPLLKISKDDFSFLIGAINKKEITAEESIKPNVAWSIQCSVPYYSKYSGLTIDQLISMNLPEIKKINNITLNRDVWGEGATGSYWTGVGYRTDYNDNCYKLILADSTSEENIKKFNEIISTFKFTK